MSPRTKAANHHENKMERKIRKSVKAKVDEFMTRTENESICTSEAIAHALEPHSIIDDGEQPECGVDGRSRGRGRRDCEFRGDKDKICTSRSMRLRSLRATVEPKNPLRWPKELRLVLTGESKRSHSFFHWSFEPHLIHRMLLSP